MNEAEKKLELNYFSVLSEAAHNPRINCLFLEANLKEPQDTHLDKVVEGFQLLWEIVDNNPRDLNKLQKAWRCFDYVVETDLKYIRCLSYLGKAIVWGHYQTGEGFREAYHYLDEIIDMTLWSPSYQSFIEELQTECRHLKIDMKARDKKLFPFGSIFLR